MLYPFDDVTRVGDTNHLCSSTPLLLKRDGTVGLSSAKAFSNASIYTYTITQHSIQTDPPPNFRSSKPITYNLENMTFKSMKKTRLVILSGVFAMLAACSAEYKLTPFSPPNGGFTALVPATPDYKTKTINAPDGAGTVHSYAVMFDDVVYGVNVIDLPEETKEAIKHPIKAEFMYAAAIQGMLASNGWRLIEEVGDLLDLSPTARIYGKKVTATIPNSAATVTVRMFVLDGRAYQAMTIVPKKTSYHQSIYPVRFLESFKLTSHRY